MSDGASRRLPDDSLPRTKILALLRERPGAKTRAIADALDCAPQSAAYHLDILARRGLIVTRRDGRSQRHFIPGQAGDPSAFMFSMLRDPRRASVIRALARSHGDPWSISQLARASGASFGLCKRVTKRLAEAGVVSLERGRSHYLLRTTPDFTLPEDADLWQPPDLRGNDWTRAESAPR